MTVRFNPTLIRTAGALALGLAAIMPGTAAAQDDSIPSTGVFKTGEEVFKICTSTDNEDLANCDWFLMAAHDMMKFYGDTDMGGSKICLPEGVKAITLRETAVSYWRGRPSARKFSAVSATYNALVQKYPCK